MQTHNIISEVSIALLGPYRSQMHATFCFGQISCRYSGAPYTHPSGRVWHIWAFRLTWPIHSAHSTCQLNWQQPHALTQLNVFAPNWSNLAPPNWWIEWATPKPSGRQTVSSSARTHTRTQCTLPVTLWTNPLCLGMHTFRVRVCVCENRRK